MPMNATATTDDDLSKMNTTSHPTLVLVRGIPGSGKSYLANALLKSIGTDKAVALDPDATDYTSKEYTDLSKSLTAEGVDEKFHPYRFIRGKAYKAITDHKILIWNQPFTNLDGFTKTIINLQAYAAEHNTQLPLLVVEVEIDHAVAKERVAKRKREGGHGPSENTFARFTNDYVSFADQGHTTVVVNGKDEVAVAVTAVMKALKTLLA